MKMNWLSSFDLILEGRNMDPIKRTSDTTFFPRLPQSPVAGKRQPAVEPQAPVTKQSSDEVYLSSCRPTRLSMELMSKAREQGSK
jgi:hypothetical protein